MKITGDSGDQPSRHTTSNHPSPHSNPRAIALVIGVPTHIGEGLPDDLEGT